MVKEFQQLRKHITQLLVKQQQEIAHLKSTQLKQQQALFLDIIELIEKLAKRSDIANQVLEQNSLLENYENIRNDLIQLLSKYDVQPITENVSSNELDKTRTPSTRYSFQGKILQREN